MEATSPLLTRWICFGLVAALMAPPVAMSQSSSPQPEPNPTPAATQSQPAAPGESGSGSLPDSPEPAQTQSSTKSDSQAPSQSVQQPAGTAAAQVENTTGEAAYKPAGAAIAPARQKRARMLLIKIGALVGAGVAIGSVAALSSASPSRPPGSH